MRAATAKIAWAGFLLASVVCAEKTDVVALVNGDRLTGEVKRLERARLTFKTDAMGTLEIEWPEVASIEASEGFEIELSSGERLYGSLAVGDGPAEVRIVGEDSEHAVAHDEVVRITRIKGGRLDRLDGNLDFGFSFVQAESASSFTLNGGLTSRTRHYERELLVRSTITEREELDRLQRSVGSFTLTRFLRQRWQTIFLGRAESNEELDLRLRTTVGGGVGRYGFQNNHSDLLFLGGLLVNREEYRSADSGDENVEGLLGVEYSLFVFGDNDTNLSIAAHLLPSFTVSARVRFETDLRFRRELVGDFYFGLTAYNSYDSEPPTVGAETNDWGVSSSIGYSF